MANHVTTFAFFENISKEAEEFLTNIDLDKDSDEVLMDFTEEKVGDNGQDWVDAYGAKWVYIDDIYEDTVHLCSAWSPPEGMLNKIYEKLQSLNSPDLLMWACYEDEMPNFVGVWGRVGDYDYENHVEEHDYKSVIGCEPHFLDEDEEGNTISEYNDEWDEKLDEWRDSEYNLFKECHELQVQYRA